MAQEQGSMEGGDTILDIEPSAYIFKVPENLRNETPDDYTPKKISIGPLHIGSSPNLVSKGTKNKWMISILESFDLSIDSIYSDFINWIVSNDQKIRKCYVYHDIPLNPSELAEVLVHDTFAIIKFLHFEDIEEHIKRYSSFFPDLFLLENQIPFFVIEGLYGLITDLKQADRSFLKRKASLLCQRAMRTRYLLASLDIQNPQHLLDILSRYFQFKHSTEKNDKAYLELARRASELYLAGANFRAKKYKPLADVKFEKGVIHISALCFNELIYTILRNLIAYEHYSPAPQYVTSMVLFYSYLIKDNEDVKLLQQNSILEVCTGDGQDPSSIFQRLIKGAVLRDFHLTQTCDQLHKFCEKPTRKIQYLWRKHIKKRVQEVRSKKDEIKVEVVREQPIPCIFKVPEKLRKKASSEYTPKNISIGPLRRKGKNLLQMEEKRKWMEEFLTSLSFSYDSIYNDSEGWIISQEASIRKCYGYKIDLSPSELAEVLVHDAFAIIRLLHFVDTEKRDEYSSFFRDLLLLGNQIPFFVLEDLYGLVDPEQADDLFFIRKVILLYEKATNTKPQLGPSDIQNPGHLLDILSRCFQPKHSTGTGTNDEHKLQLMGQASELYPARVKFHATERKPLTDIKFRRAVLHIPPICSNKFTYTLLRNLIAYEDCSPGPKYVTSMVRFYSRLLEDNEDVELLKQKSILKVCTVDGQDVCSMFKKLVKGLEVKDFHLAETCENLHKFCKRPTRKFRADIFRQYLKEPLGALTLILIIIFLGVLPMLQTIYTIASYYKT